MIDEERQREREKTRVVFHTVEWQDIILSDLTNGLLAPFLIHLSCKVVCACVKNWQAPEPQCENVTLASKIS